MAHITLARPMPHRPRTGWLSRMSAALRLRKERLDLSGLTDTQLRDIGVTRTEAETEARRPAWDAPRHWHR